MQLGAHLPDMCSCPAEYVRNHGAVPKLEWETHKIAVTGMVDKPMTFTMNDLVTKFENVTLLCTLVCAGNRRKEQNMIKKTKGFNWGASGTGTGDALLHVITCALQCMGPSSMLLLDAYSATRDAACCRNLQRVSGVEVTSNISLNVTSPRCS